MVAEGFGVGIVPDVAAIRHLPLAVLPIKDLTYRRYIYMGTLKNHYQSLLAHQFARFIEENYKIHELFQ